MNATSQIRIMLVDDHFLVRMGLLGTLGAEPDMTVVAEAENGTEAITQFRRFQPDVTLMDLRLPGMDGIESTAAIRREFPKARIIVLSTYDGDEDIHRALETGASGYLLKKFSATIYCGRSAMCTVAIAACRPRWLRGSLKGLLVAI